MASRVSESLEEQAGSSRKVLCYFEVPARGAIHFLQVESLEDADQDEPPPLGIVDEGYHGQACIR